MTATAYGQLSVVNQGGVITINDNNKASPFPSTNRVSGALGVLERISVTLQSVSHGYPDDMDIILEGPDGTKTMLISDAGGQFDLVGTTFTLDSAATTAVPNEAQISSGAIYLPANYTGGDTDQFASPDSLNLQQGPTLTSGSYSGLDANLGLFIDKSGSSVNGTWFLYVMDDNVVDAGSISAWTLNLFMSPTVVITNTAAVTFNEDTSATINVFVNDVDSALSGLNLTATSDNTGLIPNGGLTFGGNPSGTNRTLTITPAANASGTATITVVAKDELGRVYPGVNSQTFTVQVNAVNDAPTMILATSSTTIPQVGISTNINIHLRDVDSDPAAVVLTATSSNPSIIPATNVLFQLLPSATTGTNRQVQIVAGAATGNATITIIATDNQGAASSNTISVTVSAASGIVGANTTPIYLPGDIPGGASTNVYPSVITIPNTASLGRVGKITVSLINVESANPSDLGVLLVSPSGQSSILMRDVGGFANQNPIGYGDTNDVRLTFDRDAASTPPDQLVTGTYLPADGFGGVDFPSPAPAGPYSVSMDAFQGSQINGDWKLYVYDIGFLNQQPEKIAGGWELRILPAPTVGNIANTSTPEDNSTFVTFQVGDYDGQVTNIVAQLVNSSDTGKVTLSTSLSGTTGTLTLTPAPNVNTGNGAVGIPIRVIAQDNTGGFTGTNTFTLYITPVNDAPVIGPISKQIARAGQSVGPIAFSVTDVETPSANITLTATSNNPKLLPPGSIILGGTDANRTIQIFPAGSQGGTADITVTATDTGDGVNPPTTGTQTFNLTVNEAANPLYENTTGINVIDPTPPATAAAASPYPSIINVSGLLGTVAEVQVTLFGITHPRPDDLDILLVGPGTTPIALVLMSDAGDENPLNNATLRFRQNAGTVPPDEGPIVSGDYAPSDYEGTSDFPAFGSPAPTPGATLDSFIGINPNGDWKLYIQDGSQGPRGGVISSWQLSVRTRPVLATIPDQTTPEDTSLRFTVSVGDNQPGVPFTVTYSKSGTPDLIQSIVTGNGQTIGSSGATIGGGNQTFTINLNPDVNGTNNVTLTITDPNNYSVSKSFNLIVTPVNDAPRFRNAANSSDNLADLTTSAAVPTSVQFRVYDVEGKATTVTATSSDQSVVANGGLIVSPATATASQASDNSALRTLTIVPNGVNSGQTTITLTAVDADGQKSTKSFVLTVARNVSFLNNTPITINDNAPATPYPSVIDVSGVNGTVSGASVVISGFTHPFPDDVDILLVSPDGRAVMLMSDAGGGNSAQNLRLTFSDGGSALPDESALQSTTYAPGNYSQAGEVNEMPSPAPVAPVAGYSTQLSSLAGVNPNGQWKLFVRDDTFPDGGAIADGWILLLQTAPTISQVTTQNTLEDTLLPVRFTVSDQDTPVTGLQISYSVQESGTVGNQGFNNPGLIGSVTLVTNGSTFPDVSYTLNILPTTNQPAAGTATNAITITATDGTTSASTKFLVVVQAVDDAPQIIGALASNSAGFTNRVVTAEDNAIVVQWQVKDVDSSLGTSSNIVIQSSNTALVPNATANIAITGPNGQAAGTTFTVSATITPAANQTGTTVLSFIVADRSQTSTNQVTVEVTPVNDLPTVAFPTLGNSQSTSVAVGGSVTVPVSVGDVETPAQDIIVTATTASGDQDVIPNSSLVLGGRGSDRTLTITPIGSVTSTRAVVVTVKADDTTGGTTTRSFTVNVTPPPGQIYKTTGTISIPGTGSSGPASPYPSQIVVSGAIGNVSKISVSIDGLTHTAPDDIDMLLVSPTGKKVMLMSDAGGRNPVTNIQLIFDSTGRALPDEGQLTTGTYQPTDWEVGTDLFPTPAPSGPYTASLQDLIGGPANGTWSLYIVDDANNDLGQIATGWSLRIETAPDISLTSSLNQGTYAKFNEDTGYPLTFTINDISTPPVNLALSYSSSTYPLTIITNSVVVGPNNLATYNVTVVPATNAFGTNNLSIVVRRNDGAQASLTVPLSVDAVNDVALISRLTDRTTSADTPITVPLAITDYDTPLSSIRITATSGNTTVISNTNILVAGVSNVVRGVTANSSSVAAFPPGTLDTWTNILTIVPNAAAFSASPVPITLTVDQLDNNGNVVAGQTATVTFNVTVTPVNHNPVVSGLPTLVAVEAGKNTTNIVFSVSDPDNDNPLTITATSSDQSLVRDSDIIVNIPSGAPGSRTVRVNTQPGVTGDATITLRVTDPSGGRGVGQFVVRLTATRERVFANRTPITIRDNNSADPYPSQITVSGFSGAISRVTVSLSGFWHTFPDDADLLLVSPTGQKVILMSDAGGGTPVPSSAALNIKFDDTDSNAVAVPDNSPLASTTYHVANYEGTSTDDFVNRTPAGPAAPYSEALSVFNGQSPNGAWSLYVLDDTPSDSGAITNGWSIGITTLPVLAGLSDQVSAEDVPVRQTFTIAEESFANPANFTFAVSSSNPALVPSSANNIVITGSGTNFTVNVIPAPNANTNNAGAPALITITEQTTGVSGQFRVTFTPVNDAPTVSQVADQVVDAGTFTSVLFNYSDVETAKKDLTVSVSSSDASIIPPQNVVVSGDVIRIFAGTQSGTARITLTVTDTGDGINGPQSTSVFFNVTVAIGFNAVFSNTNTITINDNSRANPYPSTVDVRGVNGSVRKVTVTLTGLTHPFPDDVDVLLVGPNGQGVVLMSDAGAGGNAQTRLNGAWLIFDDEATGNLPDNAPIIPFTSYKPTNYEVSNTEFLAPAPAGPYATTLTGAFGGINPNGTWSLYVQDDASPDAGSILGWVINIALNEVGPTLVGLQDTNVVEDAFVQVPFTVGSATLDDVSFVTSASNSNLVSSIKVGGSGANRVLNITLVPNAFGSSKITVAATDATGTRTREFTLGVSPVNDAPVFGAVSDIRISGATNLVLNITDIDTPLNQLVFFASTAGVGLITDVQFSVTNDTVIAHIVPALNQSGTERLTISVSDGSQTVSQSFNVTVVLPGPPVIAPIANVTTAVNTPVVVPIVVTDPDTPIENLVFFASAADGLVSDVRFALSSSNTVLMTLTPATGLSGTDRITVSVSDGTSTSSQSFDLTVAAPGPVIAVIPPQTTLEDVSLTLPLTITDSDTPLSQLNLFASTTNPDLVRDVTFITTGTNVTATIRLITNAFGVADITVSASDGTTTSTRTFRLTVTEVCEPPVIAAIPAQTATGSSINVVIPVTDPDDSISKLNFSASTAGSSVVSGATFSTANGVVTATFTLFPGASGSEQVTVQASDGCATASQTFTLNVSGGQPATPVLTYTKNGTNFVITVTGTVGASYVIESSSSLPVWSVLDTVTIGANGTAQLTVPITGKALFFRVRSGSGALAAQKSALLVVGNTTLAAGDLAVSNRLVSLGYTVTTKSGPSSVSADANGKTLVVVSSTISSGDVNTKFRDTTVPVVQWEQALEDDFLATGDAATDHGTTTADQTQLSIISTNHPLAAGLSVGLHTVATAGTTFSWGNPQGSAIKIATIAGNANQVAIYGYEAGATMTSTNKAAGRRVFLFLQDPGITGLTAEGLALFDAAINWAVSSDVTKPGDAVVLVNGQDDGDGTVSTGGLNPPGAEGVEHVIDNAGQKYLNFLDLNSGFIVTPSVGRTLVSGLRLWTANDSEARDPASYKLEGSVNGPNGPFTVIAQGALALPSGRNAAGTTTPLTGTNYQDVYFPNSTAYTSYRLTFPTTKQKTPTESNSMQIAEVEFFGFSQ